MDSISWLHLTDLHAGHHGLGWRWPAMESDFYRDLEEIHEAAGPFHLVLFTGDLAQAARPDDYVEVDRILEGLAAHLSRLGSTDAVLLPVPGNHDLARPDVRQGSVRALLNWSADQELQEIFWSDQNGEYRAVVDKAFAAYMNWLARWQQTHPLPSWLTLTTGLLPGEFAASISQGPLRLGVVGLNSAFLQLADGMVPGSLDLHPRQLNAACGSNPDPFARRHHLNLLMTHHPPDWLGPAALPRYRGQIMTHDWFFSHLCGHMHMPRALFQQQGGGPVHRLLQGASLFGLETWTGPQGRQEERIQGYMAARLTLEPDETARLTLWPRLAKEIKASGHVRLVPDWDNYELSSDNSLSIELRVRVLSQPSPRAASSDENGRRAPQPPGVTYDPTWYVPRPVEEKITLQTLAYSGAPVVVTAPHRSGKSTFIRRVTELLREEDRSADRTSAIILLDLGSIGPEALDSVEACMRGLADAITDGFCLERGLDPAIGQAWVEAAWRRPSTPERKLGRLLEQRLLDDDLHRLVLVMDQIDLLIGHPSGEPLFRMLRQWSDSKQTPKWQKLRLLLGVLPSKTYFIHPDAVSEFFNLVMIVRLKNFDLDQVRQLSLLYGGRWTEAELKQLTALLDGNPYLTRLILYHAALGTPHADLLDLERLKQDHCASHLNQLWLRLKQDERLLKPLCALMRNPSEPLSVEELDRLYREGLVQKRSGRFEISNPLLASYLKERC